MPEETLVATGSSNIKTYAYSPTRGVLTIEFQSGAKWEYEQLPQKVFDELKQAESKGSFFASRIKGYYHGRKVS